MLTGQVLRAGLLAGSISSVFSRGEEKNPIQIQGTAVKWVGGLLRTCYTKSEKVNLLLLAFPPTREEALFLAMLWILEAMLSFLGKRLGWVWSKRHWSSCSCLVGEDVGLKP